MYDVVAAAAPYPEYFWIGNAYGHFMAYGVLEQGDLTNTDKRLLRRGRKNNAAPPPGTPQHTPGSQAEADYHAPFVMDPLKIREAKKYSWYQYPVAGKNWLHPWQGETVPSPNKAQGYTWIKSPRYRDPDWNNTTHPDYPNNIWTNPYVPYEVGPLARMVVNESYYAGVLNDLGYTTTPTYKAFGPNLETTYGTNLAPDLSGVQYIGDSCLDRIAARAIEAHKIATQMGQWLNRLEGTAGWSPPMIGNATTSPTKPVPTIRSKGAGLTEAPRGALGHWIIVKNEQVLNYQCVVPSTWNASPMDPKGQNGPAEKAMTGLFIKDELEPLEILRVSHSWDFCTACAVHLVTPKDDGTTKEKIVKIEPSPH
jgi:Ni,Fe-hydrogenase I large subunit